MDAADELAWRVVKGHATQAHLHEFADLGVKTPEQYQAQLAASLRDPETLCFTGFRAGQAWRQADIYYHPPSNTLIVDPANQQHEPTAHRPTQGALAFYEKLTDAERHEKQEIPLAHGIEQLQRQKRDAELDRADEAVLRRYHQSRHERRLGLGRSLGRGLPGDDGE